MLHIHCGDSSAGTLRQSEVPGEVIVWCDPVCEGPTPAGASPQEWLGARASYLAGMASRTTPDGIAARLAGQDAALDRGREHDEVVLWFDACLFDQAILVRLLDRLSRTDLGAARLTLICAGEFPGMPRFLGLGELNPEQLASLFPARKPVTAVQTALAREVWEAWRAPDPAALVRLLDRDTSALPYLGDALLRRLEQFPSTRNGLDRLENEVLEAVAEGYERLVGIFATVSDREARPFMGDTTVWRVVEELSSADVPLLELEGPARLPRFDDPEPAPLSQWRVRLTDAGRAVLAGRDDHVRRSGIDRWIGGIHLLGRGPVWRWHAGQRRLVQE